MKRLLQLLSIVLSIAFINSCKEPDPATVYGWDDPNDFSGPRMIKKVLANNQTVEEYAPNLGKLFKVNRTTYDGTAIKEYQNIYLFYLGSKITKIEVNGYITTDNITGTAVLIPNYDATGRMVSLMNDFYVGSTHKKHSITVFNYDTSGKVINAYQKTASVNPATPNIYVYPDITNDIITYNGNNLEKVETTKMVVNTSSGIIQSSETVAREYSKFDSKINPYTTIPDNYIVSVSTLFTDMYAYLSENNPEKYVYTNATNVSTETLYTNKYDTHNFIINNGFRNFYYQPAP